jgi:hypothetical protein
MKTEKAIIAIALVAGLFVSSALTAGEIYSIDWHTIDGGGATSMGGTFELVGTVGQPDASSSPALAGGTFELTGGFWTVTQACFCFGDLNQDGLKDGGDIQKFVACLLAGGDCSCADVDQIGGVTIADADVFVADLLAGSSCP